MGIESYLLKLTGRGMGMQELVRFGESVLGLTSDPQQYPLSKADSYYVYRDNRHVIEFELSQRTDHCQVSVRFALCNPVSVERVALPLVTALMDQFGMKATICEGLPEGEPREYSTGERFAANFSRSIARSREEWRQMFGPEEVGLSVSDALRKFFGGDKPDI